MEKRRLGRTGQMSTIVTFGTAALGTTSQDTVDKSVELILKHEVNHIDIAPGYGQAMERMKPWMPKIRDQMFLGCKTQARTYSEAWENIKDGMERLGTEGYDLFQLHAVTTIAELDGAMMKGGAIDALVEMREQGLTKWLGITGHGPYVPKVQLEALKRFDFDTIMFPLSASIYRNPEYRNDAEALLEYANSCDVGIQTIKLIARGGWGSLDKDCRTWYDPHREQKCIDDALNRLYSQPIHTAPSVGEVTLLPKVLNAAERIKPLAITRQEEIVAEQRPLMEEPRLAIPA